MLIQRSPVSPATMDWSALYPSYVSPERSKEQDDEVALILGDEAVKPKPLTKDVDVADIGCGFGGLLVALAPELTDSLLLGQSSEDSG
jgi:tRNA G46 methylase TrmB